MWHCLRLPLVTIRGLAKCTAALGDLTSGVVLDVSQQLLEVLLDEEDLADVLVVDLVQDLTLGQQGYLQIRRLTFTILSIDF